MLSRMFCLSGFQMNLDYTEDGGSMFIIRIGTYVHGVISQKTAMTTSNLAYKTNLDENYRNFD
jgi:hypothetical protein